MTDDAPEEHLEPTDEEIITAILDAKKATPAELRALTEPQLCELEDQLKDSMDPKHWKFTWLVDQGRARKHAYMEAGYKAKGNAAEVNGSKLLRNTKVMLMLAILQEGNQRVAAMDVNWFAKRFASLGKQGEKLGKIAEARGCFAEAAKILGAYPAEQHKLILDRPLTEPNATDVPAMDWDKLNKANEIRRGRTTH